MPMIKRGDGSTGHIVEAVDSDDKGVCSSCGHLFAPGELTDGKCGACQGGAIEAKAEETPKSCCCEDKKSDA